MRHANKAVTFSIQLLLCGFSFFCGLAADAVPQAEPSERKKSAQISRVTPGANSPDRSSQNSAKDLTAADIEKLLKGPNVSYESHITAARFFEERGLISQAEEQLHMAIDFKDAKPEVYKKLAQLLLRSQDQKEAEQVILNAVKKFPDDYGVLLNAGVVLQRGQKNSQALDLFDRASAVRPNQPDIWLARGDVLIEMKRPKDGLASVEKALAMPNPSSLAYYEDAKALLALGRLDDALVPLNKNFEKDAFNFNSGLVYSSLLQKLGKLEDALEVRLCLLASSSGKSMDDVKLMVNDLILKLPPADVQHAIARAEKRIPNNDDKAVLHFALGDIYDRAHRADNGMLQYKQGLLLNPHYGRGYFRLGKDFEDSKSNYKEALSNYEKAYALSPADPEIKTRLEKLRIQIKKQK